MKSPFALRRLLTILSLTIILPVVTQAAENAPARDAASAKAGSADPMSLPFDLEVRNGFIIENGKQAGDATIGNIVEYLKHKGLKFNIILKPGVAGVKAGDLVLHQPEFNNIDLFEAVARSTSNVVLSGGDGPSTLYYNEEPGSRLNTRVFNLTSYLNPDGKADDKSIHEKLDHLTDIIFKTLTDLDPGFSDATQPHYQFHQGANLLVVISQERYLEVVSQIVDALTEPPNPYPFPSGDTVKSVAAQWSNTDPAAALAWVQSLPAPAQADGSRRKADLATMENLFAKLRNLQDGTPGKPLSPQEIQDFEKQMEEMQKMVSEFQKLLPKENPPAASAP